MPRERVKQIMAQTFGVPFAEIPDDAAIEEYPAWTSLGHLELMMALEMEFGVSIPASTMLELLTLDAIVDYLGSQGMSAAA
ncbi:MAG: acyl carrier protein [Planctomycetota bacterium]